jgi:GLPGLI family protein
LVFQSIESLKRDSLANVILQSTKIFATENFSNLISKKNDFDYKIIKTKKSLVYKEIIANQTYCYNETPAIDWVITSEKVKVDEFNCQKAYGYFGGRKWYAFFDVDNPLQVTPYKFYGLPGLVTMVYDEANIFNWKLIGISKNENFRLTEKNYMETQGFPTVKVDKIKFQKILRNFVNNPYGNISEVFPYEDKNSAFMRNLLESEKKEKDLYKNKNYLEKVLLEK